MGGTLMPRPRDAMRTLDGADPLTPGLPAKVQRAVDHEFAWALVGSARAQAVGYVAAARIDAVEQVTEQAMFGLDRLRKVEAVMARDDPIQASQFSGLLDDYVTIARWEIRQLPRQF